MVCKTRASQGGGRLSIIKNLKGVFPVSGGPKVAYAYQAVPATDSDAEFAGCLPETDLSRSTSEREPSSLVSVNIIVRT